MEHLSLEVVEVVQLEIAPEELVAQAEAATGTQLEVLQLELLIQVGVAVLPVLVGL